MQCLWVPFETEFLASSGTIPRNMPICSCPVSLLREVINSMLNIDRGKLPHHYQAVKKKMKKGEIAGLSMASRRSIVLTSRSNG